MEQLKCVKCGNDLPEGVEFCFKCGNKIIHEDNAEKKVCPVCNNELVQEAIFCPKCGTNINEEVKVEKKKRTGIKWIILLILIVLGIITIVAVKYSAQKKEDERRKEITTYIEEANKIYSLIDSAADDLDLIGFMYDTAIETDGGLLTQDVLINYCTSLCSAEIVSAKDTYEDVKTAYNKLPECKEEEITDLSLKLEDMYDLYEEYYKFIIDKGFSTYNFKTTYASKKNAHNNSKDEVKEILDLLINEFPAVDINGEKEGNIV